MDPVKNSRHQTIVLNMEDMNKAKNDAPLVKCFLNGKVCGVLVVDVY